MLFPKRLVTRPQQNLGNRTCSFSYPSCSPWWYSPCWSGNFWKRVVVVVCLLRPRSGVNGIVQSMLTRSDTLSYLLLLRLLFLLLFLHEGIRLRTYVPELPLVFGDDIESVEKTSSASKVLKTIDAYPDVKKAKNSIAIEKSAVKETRDY